MSGTRDRDPHDGAQVTSRPLRYALPAPAGTVLLGLHPSSLAGLGVTATVAVLLLLASTPVWAVVPAAVVGGMVSALPLAGRTLLDWVPTSARHLTRRWTGQHRWTRPAPSSTATPLGPPPVSATVSATSAPPVRVRLGVGPRRLQLEQLAGGHAAPVGVLRAGRDRPATVVLEVTGTGRFGLLDPAGQDSELSRWGASLNLLLADPAITGVQWLTYTRPDTRPAALGAADPPAGTDTDLLQRDYRELLAEVRGQALQHRHLLALTLTPDPGTATQPDGALLGRVREVAAALLGAGLLSSPLSAAELGSTLRLLLDPALPDLGTRPDPGCWAALSARESWTSCRTDDTVHRCFTVCGWPRLALPADWLAPLLHDPPPPGTARTLAVHARPVAPAAAARRARAASARVRLDAADRHRLGFSAAPTELLDHDDAAATEAELVAGYRMADLSAVLTVSAGDLDQLDTASRAVRAHASAQRLDLRPLHGQHRHALAAALPLGLHPGGQR